MLQFRRGIFSMAEIQVEFLDTEDDECFVILRERCGGVSCLARIPHSCPDTIMAQEGVEAVIIPSLISFGMLSSKSPSHPSSSCLASNETPKTSKRSHFVLSQGKISIM